MRVLCRIHPRPVTKISDTVVTVICEVLGRTCRVSRSSYATRARHGQTFRKIGAPLSPTSERVTDHTASRRPKRSARRAVFIPHKLTPTNCKQERGGHVIPQKVMVEELTS